MIKERKYYLDNIKIFLLLMVILHHGCQAYSKSIIGWYFYDNDKVAWTSSFLSVNAAFLMSTFFFIAGYFTPNSYDKKGAKRFAIDRIKKFIPPLLLLVIVIIPGFYYLADNLNMSFFQYYIDYYWKGMHVSYQHGWFIMILLIFSLGYCLVNKFLKNNYYNGKSSQITIRKLVVYSLVLGIISSLLRMKFSQDYWVVLFGFIGFEPCHIGQYLFAFILGIISFRFNWIDSLDEKVGKRSFIVAMILSIILWTNGFLENFFSKTIFYLFGIYESFLCLFIIIGLVYVFKKYLNKTNHLVTTISKCTFGVYIIHNFWVMFYQVFFSRYRFNGNIKFTLVGILTIITSFLCIYIYKKIVYYICDKI